MARKILCGLLMALVVGGCKTKSPYDRSYVSEGLQERTDYELGEVAEPGIFSFPAGVSLDDGLSQDEAVALALWNNAQFQADLAALGFSRADVLEAGMLPNPVFSIFFPVGPKLLEARLSYPIDVLWTRPHRVKAAKLDAHTLAENLIEHGLALVRDVRLAYVDLVLAEERVRLAREDVAIRSQAGELARKRLAAGDISELAASAAIVDALQAANDLERLSGEARIMRQRLDVKLGVPDAAAPYNIEPETVVARTTVPIETLLETAFAARPDLRAVELQMEAAGERLGWEKSKVFNLIAHIDAKDKGDPSVTIGPGLSAEIPIFNQNDGNIARARAEIDQAARQYEALRQSIRLQVQEAHIRYLSAHDEYDIWSSDILPNLAEAAEQAQKSFAAGEVSYLTVLEARQKLAAAQKQQTELTALLNRNFVQLNYCVGQKLI
ncbi:TolC family protein [Planctomycetota bacterium]